MPSEGTAIFYGESGDGYQFNIYKSDTNFRNISAVYIFCKATIDNDLNLMLAPLYIGETDELGDRIAKHEKLECVIFEGCTHICIKAVSGRKTRLEVEKDLRHNYPTPCNDQ
ncbi:hypothetical protein [Desulfovibrio sp. ZJ369]|uniref:hypothetical protein n=1 Tax=Desulfovibrio sp. ZJ369 TaxID=2709793 RepID=UPI0013EB78D0|nr:hypothetical protein [Desulfovibrio sp. ZJ369]